MASLIDWLFMSGARDVDGNPIASGSAYFYFVGSTSEAIAVYSDKDGNNPLAQPVLLDAAGRAEVYAVDQCEIIVKDSLGVTKRLTQNGKSIEAEQVNVTWGAEDATLDEALTAIEPATTYKESDAIGAVTRAPHDAIHRVIMPQDFGAVGDGTSDDSEPLQAAINRAVAANLPLDLGSANYKVTAGLVANGPISIFGSSRNTKITASAGTFDVLTVAASPAPLADSGFSLRDFSVIAPYGASNCAVKVTSGKSGQVTGLMARGCFGIEASGATNTRISSCYVEVKGNVSTAAIGINAGDASFVGSCKVECNPDGSGVQYSTGVKLSGDGGLAVRCQVFNSDFGISLVRPTTQKNLAIGCSATSCVHSFAVNGSRTGAIGCASVTPSSVDYDNGYPENFIDIANTWTTDPTDSHVNELIDAKLDAYGADVVASIGAQVSGWSLAESSGVSPGVTGTVSDIFRLSVPGTPMTDHVGMKTVCFTLSDIGTPSYYIDITLSGTCAMPNKFNVSLVPKGDWFTCMPKVDYVATNVFRITYLEGSAWGSHPGFYVQVHGW